MDINSQLQQSRLEVTLPALYRTYEIYVLNIMYLEPLNKTSPKFVDFFMANADSSLQTASILQEISDDNSLKETLRVSSGFESYLWVIVSSYYSMFYAATAMLAKQGIKATGQIVHKETADALIHFFGSNDKLANYLSSMKKPKLWG